MSDFLGFKNTNLTVGLPDFPKKVICPLGTKPQKEFKPEKESKLKACKSKFYSTATDAFRRKILI